jgi:hypothetical protein
VTGRKDRLTAAECYWPTVRRSSAGAGWSVIELKTHHLAPLTGPAIVAEFLHELLIQLHQQQFA